jgi:hypothetical protein
MFNQCSITTRVSSDRANLAEIVTDEAEMGDLEGQGQEVWGRVGLHLLVLLQDPLHRWVAPVVLRRVRHRLSRSRCKEPSSLAVSAARRCRVSFRIGGIERWVNSSPRKNLCSLSTFENFEVLCVASKFYVVLVITVIRWFEKIHVYPLLKEQVY